MSNFKPGTPLGVVSDYVLHGRQSPDCLPERTQFFMLFFFQAAIWRLPPTKDVVGDYAQRESGTYNPKPSVGRRLRLRPARLAISRLHTGHMHLSHALFFSPGNLEISAHQGRSQRLRPTKGYTEHRSIYWLQNATPATPKKIIKYGHNTPHSHF